MRDRYSRISQPDSPQNFTISHDDIRLALDNLIYTTTDPSESPLTHLQLVTDFLDVPYMPASRHARHFAVNTILTEAICRALTSCHQAVQLPDVAQDGSQSDVLRSIMADAKTGQVELLGWDWLYCRYVRPELNITPERFSAAAHLDVRTLRRYQRHAILRLTLQVIAWEREARCNRHHKRLYTQLPLAVPVRMFGRDEALGHVQRLVTGAQTQQIQVNGSAGSGKTTFVQEAVRQQIDAGAVDYLIWIDQAATMAQVQHDLQQMLPVTTCAASLRECAARYQLVVVLDGIQALLAEQSRLEALLNDLSTEVVYLADRQYCALPNVLGHLTLLEFDRETTVTFVRWLFERDNVLAAWYDKQAVMDMIWEQTCGNPQRIKQLLCDLRQEAGRLSV